MCGDWGCAPTRKFAEVDTVALLAKSTCGYSCPACLTGDSIHIGGDFPDEFTESKYTKKLRGALAKAKANASTVIPDMIRYATNRRRIENKDEKHSKDAPNGWYRYDTVFGMPVQGSQENEERVNMYRATLVVRIKEDKLYLYDILDIKKEASTPHES